MKKTLATLACLAILPAGAAFAGDDNCRASTNQMQSETAVIQLAKDYMWSIDSMKIDGGCYELRVTDPGGNSIKAKIDPATLDVIDAKVEQFANEGPASEPASPPAN